jgi:SAM-dependent methyltransferase
MSDDRFLRMFDGFVNWPARLSKEGPFLDAILKEAGATRVLDAGAGPGRHAVWLAKKGYRVLAADIAETMIEETRRHAREEGAAVEAVRCSFEEIPGLVSEPVDAVQCLGNSLCMLPDAAAVRRSCAAFGRVLRPGGALVLHSLNYRGLRATGKRVSRPTAVPGGGLLLKVFDLDPGAVRVNLIRMEEKKPGTWNAEHVWAPLLALSREEFEGLLSECGFGGFRAWGGADGSAYEPDVSYDLFLAAKKS